MVHGFQKGRAASEGVLALKPTRAIQFQPRSKFVYSSIYLFVWESLDWSLRWTWYLMICTGREVRAHVGRTSAEKSAINAFLRRWKSDFKSAKIKITWTWRNIVKWLLKFPTSFHRSSPDHIKHVFSGVTSPQNFDQVLPWINGVPVTQKSGREKRRIFEVWSPPWVAWAVRICTLSSLETR